MTLRAWIITMRGRIREALVPELQELRDRLAREKELNIAALRAALAEPEPEPVAWLLDEGDGSGKYLTFGKPEYYKGVPLYIAPPIRRSEPEPVAIHQFRKRGCIDWFDGHPDHTDGRGPYVSRTLYTAPPPRRPLTDEEIERLWYPSASIAEAGKRRVAFGRAIERAHGIGGNDE